MNKRIAIICVLILLSIGGGMAYLLTTDEGKQAKDQTQTTTQTNTEASTMPSQTTTTTETPGAYVEYSDTVIANTKGTKLLFFHAPWCPQCRALDADIKAGNVPSSVTIIKTDYDTHQSLRQKYGVTIQTTIVKVDDNGELIKKYVAYDEPTLNAVITNLL